ncbi:hypothetical protein HMPREF3224_02631 [Anaerococcus hydrogenalis]|nr:hypothetical protein HMPREF3224_02631 [Anaerococcus hydrogenalis]
MKLRRNYYVDFGTETETYRGKPRSRHGHRFSGSANCDFDGSY